MYNRYIPQADGTYRRNRIPDRNPAPQHPPKNEYCRPDPPECIPEEDNGKPPVFPVHKEIKPAQPCRTSVRKEKPSQQDMGIDSFLRRLLPKDFDTGDLLIVILLLLMAGDCPEDHNTALLTLLIYFFI